MTRREGRDFHTQQQWAGLPATPTADYQVGRLVARLSAALLRELWMFERTGQLPEDVSWSGQPAWRVELWEAFWQAQIALANWPPLDYPLCASEPLAPGEDYE